MGQEASTVLKMLGKGHGGGAYVPEMNEALQR